MSRKILFIIYNSITAILLILLFVKSVVDVDVSYDTWMYHIPFAARILNIIPLASFEMEHAMELYYQGFPIFYEMLQGLFWYVTNRIESTNLVSFLSFLLYLYFLHKFLSIQIPFLAISLLAIPLLQVHSTLSYVDLPGSLSLAALFFITCNNYLNQKPEKLHITSLVLTAFFTINSKLSFIPIVGIILLFNGVIFCKKKSLLSGVHKRLLFIAIPIIFYIPIKNLILFNNPLHPYGFKIAGYTLIEGLRDLRPKEFTRPSDENHLVTWLISIFEIKSGTWSVDQWSHTPGYARLGGFNGLYVAWNLLLLIYLIFKEKTKLHKTYGLAFLMLSICVAFSPLSDELRYYMYWMITLVSLNLYFLSIRISHSTDKLAHTTKIINLCFLGYLLYKTNYHYITPRFYGFENLKKDFVNEELVRSVLPNHRKICIQYVNPRLRAAILHTNYFQPQIKNAYFIKETYDTEKCKEFDKIFLLE